MAKRTAVQGKSKRLLVSRSPFCETLNNFRTLFLCIYLFLHLLGTTRTRTAQAKEDLQTVDANPQHCRSINVNRIFFSV